MVAYVWTEQNFTTDNLIRSNGVWVRYAGYPKVETVVRHSTNWPDTKQRVKPLNLFANGTARTTSSTFRASNAVDRTTSTTRILGNPAISIARRGTSDVPLAEVESFSRMENKIREKARGNVANLAMALAEYKKTAALFVSAARVVSSRGKSLAAALKQKSGVSKSWLGFQYGVRPLVGDMLTSLEELRNASGSPLYITGYETRKGTRNETELRGPTSLPNVYSRYEYHSKVVRRIRWQARCSPGAVRNVLTAHGFTNPFSLAYELIPYSFVLDWWINVGDVLASLDNLLLFENLSVIRSESITRSCFFDWPHTTYTQGGGIGRTDVTSGTGHTIFREDIRYAPRQVSLVSTFQYEPSTSLMHVLNGLALLRVARGRFR